MSDISQLQERIESAFGRIGNGLDALGARGRGVDPGEVAALQAALDEEKTANAQLEERVRAIHEKQESTLAQLSGEVERLRAELAEHETGSARLRRANSELRANNEALREAMHGGVAEPHLINKAMMAELEAVRAAQAADRAELDAVLAELGALIASTGQGAQADEGSAQTGAQDEESTDA